MVAYSFPKRVGLEAIRKHLHGEGFSEEEARHASLPIYDQLRGKSVVYLNTRGKSFLQIVRSVGREAKNELKNRGKLPGITAATARGTEFLSRLPTRVVEKAALDGLRRNFESPVKTLSGQKRAIVHSSHKSQPLLKHGWFEVDDKRGFHITKKGRTQYGVIGCKLGDLDWDYRREKP